MTKQRGRKRSERCIGPPDVLAEVLKLLPVLWRLSCMRITHSMLAPAAPLRCNKELPGQHTSRDLLRARVQKLVERAFYSKNGIGCSAINPFWRTGCDLRHKTMIVEKG